jgi:hypothetical protein
VTARQKEQTQAKNNAKRRPSSAGQEKTVRDRRSLAIELHTIPGHRRHDLSASTRSQLQDPRNNTHRQKKKKGKNGS